MKFNRIIISVWFVLFSFSAISQNEKIELLKEIIPGSDFSAIEEFGVLESKSLIFFSADDDEHGKELWVSDGTAEGTHLLKNINTQLDYDYYELSSSPEYFYPMGDYVYFRADDGIHGIEPWRSDGTTEGTVMIADVFPGGMGSLHNGPYFCEYNNELFFNAMSSSATGIELWKTDGTEAGTVMVKDINPADSKSSSPQNLIVYNNLLYFVAEYPNNHSNIYVSDGTADGTQLVYDIYPGGYGIIAELLVCNNLIFFKGATEEYGVELYRTNGTAEGTFMLKDINTEGDGINFSDEMITYNNEIYFKGSSQEYGAEPWKSNGTSEGTVLLKDINPEYESYALSSYPGVFKVFDGKLFFRAKNASSNYNLWVSDGTLEGTEIYSDINDTQLFSPRLLTVCDNKLYLVASHDGYGKLMSLNKSENGTFQIIGGDNFAYNSSCSFMQLFTMNSKLYFHAQLEADKGYELYHLVQELDQNIELADDEITLLKDETYELTASIDPEGENDAVEWKSLDEEIAIVNENGLITAVYGGQTKIVASLAGTDKSDTCIVNVQLPVEDVILTPDQVSLSVGETKMLNVVVMPLLYIVDASVTWKSLDENIAKVNLGVITATGSGETDVVVTTVSGGFTDTCKVVVSNPNGVDDLDNSDIRIYPNPVENNLYVEGLNSNDRIEIYTLDGKQLPIYLTNNIDVSNIKFGIYILKIYTGQKVYNKKIVKQ